MKTFYDEVLLRVQEIRYNSNKEGTVTVCLLSKDAGWNFGSYEFPYSTERGSLAVSMLPLFKLKIGGEEIIKSLREGYFIKRVADIEVKGRKLYL